MSLAAEAKKNALDNLLSNDWIGGQTRYISERKDKK